MRPKSNPFEHAGPLARLLAICVLIHMGSEFSFSQRQPDSQLTRKQLIQKAYAKHDVKIRHLLPSYSGPPLLLNMFQRRIGDGMCDPEQHVAWETHFKGIMAGVVIADLGFSKPADATATTLVTIDTFAPIRSLPAKRSFAVVMAEPIAGRVCVPRSRRYVYTKFKLKILKEYREGRSNKHGGPRMEKQITAVEFGGSVRFPSGYLETFLLSQEGFIEIGKRYILFMWKPVASDKMLVISQAYLIRDGLVYPVSSNGDAQTVYTKMPFPEFEAKVKAAVARNLNADIIRAPKGATR